MTISAITGARQGRWLRTAVLLIVVAAVLGMLAPGSLGETAAAAAVILIILTPLARVVWIIYRLAQEHDRRFVLVGVALLSVVAFGVLVALFLR